MSHLSSQPIRFYCASGDPARSGRGRASAPGGAAFSVKSKEAGTGICKIGTTKKLIFSDENKILLSCYLQTSDIKFPPPLLDEETIPHGQRHVNPLSGGQPAACMRRGLISGEGGNLYAISDAKPSQPFSRPEAAHLVWLTLPPSWKRAM